MTVQCVAYHDVSATVVGHAMGINNKKKQHSFAHVLPIVQQELTITTQLHDVLYTFAYTDITMCVSHVTELMMSL